MDVQLAHSHYGFYWHRTSIGEKLIPLKQEGSWDTQFVVLKVGEEVGEILTLSFTPLP